MSSKQTESISSQPRYDHFDTSPYKIVKAKPNYQIARKLRDAEF